MLEIRDEAFCEPLLALCGGNLKRTGPGPGREPEPAGSTSVPGGVRRFLLQQAEPAGRGRGGSDCGLQAGRTKSSSELPTFLNPERFYRAADSDAAAIITISQSQCLASDKNNCKETRKRSNNRYRGGKKPLFGGKNYQVRRQNSSCQCRGGHVCYCPPTDHEQKNHFLWWRLVAYCNS